MMEPIKFGESGESLGAVQSYLVRYGYMSGAVPREARLLERTSASLARFQRFSLLAETGEADAATLERMARQRCGVSDWEGNSALRPWRWPVGQDTLVYQFENETGDVDNAGDAHGAVRDAIATWNDVLEELHIPLRFKEKTEQVPELHVSIRWDEADLDLGLTGTPVAHADLPPACGRVTRGRLPKPVHFDDKEHTWGVEPNVNTFHIYSVALHELGHILGLVHPPGQGGSAVMACTLGPMEILTVPSDEDKAILRSLYG